MNDPDANLDGLDRDALLATAKQMRRAIREHRDSIGHDLCWHHPGLGALLPDFPHGGLIVPEWPQFLRGFIRYGQSLDEQLADASRSDKEFGG